SMVLILWIVPIPNADRKSIASEAKSGYNYDIFGLSLPSVCFPSLQHLRERPGTWAVIHR
ncbi:MAG TPA: hypothetical protein VK140_11570, partial [Ktedonobacteraceae bacterium]|nr:hypothetical protein [Ktedonobacteraceae bacterium]